VEDVRVPAGELAAADLDAAVEPDRALGALTDIDVAMALAKQRLERRHRDEAGVEKGRDTERSSGPEPVGEGAPVGAVHA
jgi:hypothetical protein